MAATTFTLDAAKRIIAATRKVERMGQDLAGGRNPAASPTTEFWAYLTEHSLDGRRHSWIQIVPKIHDPAFTLDTIPVFDLPANAVTGWENAYEANGRLAVPAGTVVRLHFAGYSRDGSPAYLFTHAETPQEQPMGIHDHRDNWHGGFAFSVFHPGTALPQQRWGI